MTWFVQATTASRPKTKNVRTVGISLASVLVVMAVAQLFTYEKFSGVISAMWFPGSEALAPVRAALIVIFEVGAIPFLLSMRLSPAMRFLSMISGWLAIAGWLGASVWQNLSSGVIANNGLLGTTIKLPVGWWSILFCIALSVLAAWAAWGLWPLQKRSK